MIKALPLKFLLGLLFCQLIVVCNSFGQAIYKVKADIKGLGDRSVIIRYTRQGIFTEDTIKASQNQFVHSIATTDGNIATLILDPATQLVFWLEPPLISITGSLGPVTKLICTGTPENNLLESYRNTIEKPYSIRKKGKSVVEADPITLKEYEATRQFIKQHPASLTAAYLLYWQAVYDVTIFGEIEQLLASLSPSIKSSYWAQKAETRIFNVRNRPRIGKKVPSFTLPDTTNHPVSLESLRGKYVLIDFWGTWCKPCILTIPELKAVYNKFSDRLTIISIAQEMPRDREKWLRTIRKYDMTWIQAVEFTGLRDDVTSLYNVIGYPTLLLIDPDGILLAKINYGESIEDRISQLLNKKNN